MKSPNLGGKAPKMGAGRKKGSGKGRSAISRSISMSRQSWDKLDQARGGKPRGKFIAALLT
jgi:hypothetical protein